VRVTYAEELELTFTKVDVRGENRRGLGGGFETITQELHADGDVDEATIAHVCDRAQAVCFTHNTLKHGVKLVTVIHLNGEEVLRSISEPTGFSL
jgi:uncharacterized OsmC-like protein